MPAWAARTSPVRAEEDDVQRPADEPPRRRAGPDPRAPSVRDARPHACQRRSPKRTRNRHLRPWHAFLGSLVFLALVAADCGGPWVSSVQVRPGGATLSTGEPTVLRALVQGDAHPGDFCPIAEAVTWTTADPSVAIVTETGIDDDPFAFRWGHRLCGSPFAVVRGVSSGTTEIIVASDFNPGIRDRASITVTDDLKPGFIELVGGARSTTIGETLVVEVDVALYGTHEPQAAAVGWEIDDTAVVTTEDTGFLELAPHVYRSTLLLRGSQAGVATVRPTNPLLPLIDPWDHQYPAIVAPVTVASEAGTPFVVIRGGDRTVNLGDGFCVSAYVGMPVDDPDPEDAWIRWSLKMPGVLEFGGMVWGPMNSYPFEINTCLAAIGPGVTELVATSTAWPDASTQVSIEVIE